MIPQINSCNFQFTDSNETLINIILAILDGAPQPRRENLAGTYIAYRDGTAKVLKSM